MTLYLFIPILSVRIDDLALEMHSETVNCLCQNVLGTAIQMQLEKILSSMFSADCLNSNLYSTLLYLFK